MKRQLCRFLLIFVMYFVSAAIVPIVQVVCAQTFQPGDVFVSLSDNINGGKIEWHRSNGTLVKTLYLGTTSKSPGAVGAPAGGMGFDSQGNLYVTQPNDGYSGRVLKFDANGNLLDPNWGHPSFPGFGYTAPYKCKPGAIVFDSKGLAYIGHLGCAWNEGSMNRTTSIQPAGTKMVNVIKLAASDGTVQAGQACPYPNTSTACHPEGPDSEGMLHVVAESQSANRLALASDDCTLYYTSAGRIKVFNVCTPGSGGVYVNNNGQQYPSPVQLPDQVSFPAGTYLRDIRVLPDGSMVVADGRQIEHLDANGRLMAPLDPHSSYFRKQIVSLALNVDGTSLWVADNDSGQVYKVNLSGGSEDRRTAFFVPQYTIRALAVAPGTLLVMNVP